MATFFEMILKKKNFKFFLIILINKISHKNSNIKHFKFILKRQYIFETKF